MLKRRYYYFVAGLTDLLFDSGKNLPDMKEFREELQKNLHPDDYRLTQILFLPHDNRNLASFLKENHHWDNEGNYSREIFEEQKRILSSILKEKDVLPEYMVKIMSDWYESETGIKDTVLNKRLAEGYVDTALKSGNKFLEKWVRFDTDLRNIFIFLNSKTLELEADNYLTGSGTFVEELSELFKSGKDFIIPSEPEYAPAIFKIATENEFLERERKTDLERWSFIDSLTFFEYFTIDFILGYLIKYSIVLRWLKLEPETGKKMLQKFVTEMEKNLLSGDLSRNSLM
ncbi:MAG: DUF2764 family protein [Bacteroidales bacterium]|nr:DUF2764 family protein [Bacteroidales bacterium]